MTKPRRLTPPDLFDGTGQKPKQSYRSLELPIHRSILAYLKLMLPDAVHHHSAQNLGVKGPEIARMVALAKSMGMLPGFPDLITVTGGRLLCWEVKAPGGKLSDAQEAVRMALVANGAMYAEVQSVDDVRDCMRVWGVETRENGR